MNTEKTLDQIFGEMKDLHDNFLTAAEQFLEKQKEPKFKAGDFLFEDYSTGFLFIFNGIINCRSEISCPVSILDGSFSFNKKDHTFVNFKKVRFATEAEKQLLIDKLHENGKDWNAEKKEIVDYKWKPEKKENFFYLNRYGWVTSANTFPLNGAERGELIKNGNYYKTRELAEAAHEAEVEFRKSLKHF